MNTPLPQTLPVELTLAQRGNVHGNFADNALATQVCLEILKDCPSWKAMSSVQKTATFHIVHKLARACSGDPNHVDHWHDIQGYAKLVEDSLKP